MLNRREMLQHAAAGLLTLGLPLRLTAQPTPKPKKTYPFWTQQQLLRLLQQLDGKTTRETVDMKQLRDGNHIYQPHEMIYLALIRMANIMHRKNLDYTSSHWLVINPALARAPYWPGHQFGGVYSTPGKLGGTWTQPGWQHFIKELVAPGVYNVGMVNCKWTLYVCPQFPDNKILLGMGFKQVVHHRKEGVKHYSWGTIPNLVPYLDKPTAKNYAVITLC